MTVETSGAWPTDGFEQRLVAVLAAEAATVVTPGDGLIRIHARITHRRRARRTTWLLAAAAVVLVVGTVAVTLRSADTTSAPYVDVRPDGSGAEPIRTPDVMVADWDHPALLVPGNSQWTVQEYVPWSYYTVGAVVSDDDGPRHVGVTVESNGRRDVVAEPWPGERRVTIDGTDAVLTATRDSTAILWHPTPELTARLGDWTESDARSAELAEQQQQAFDDWAAAGGQGVPPVPTYPAPNDEPVPVDDATAARLVRLASSLVAADRATWLQAVDQDGVVLVTGAGPEGPVADTLATSGGGGGTPRVALPTAAGRTTLRFSPSLATTTYEFDVDGFPEGTFLLDVAVDHPEPGMPRWEPVTTETQGGISGKVDALTPIYSPATVRGTGGEFEHYPATTLERTDPTHSRTLRWISDGYSWRLRFGGAASGADAVAFADSLVLPDDARWEALAFPDARPPGDPGSVFELDWLTATGQEQTCSFGEICP